MPSEKELFYSRVAKDFNTLMNKYDLERRLAIVFDLLLSDDICNKTVLDAGCGNGWFSRKALERGAVVVSLDISYEMLRHGKSAYQGRFVNASALELPFADGQFDIVLSSEMIEHTPDPILAISELSRVLKPGGTLALTTPNRMWHWFIHFFTLLRIRPFQGIENFLTFGELDTHLALNKLAVQLHFGFHPWPFQIRFLQALSHKVDRRFGETEWGKWMINQAVCALKQSISDGSIHE